MEVIRHAGEIRVACAADRASGRSLGFVPTMGFFHEGHLSLMRKAREDRDHVVLSIFVNPLQFGPAEDFASYPRDLDRDLALAEKEGVDTAFVPEVEEMYPDGPPETTIDPGPLAVQLEGAARPGHFRGVCTVLARLFHLIGPSRAYFGQKDAQQVAVVRQMVRDLAFPIEVEACPTVREPDGLAMSSRNTYLAPKERKAAASVPAALHAGSELVRRGERDAGAVLAAIRGRIDQEPKAELDYVAVVDEATFEGVTKLSRPARALIAVRIGRARLIDNTLLSVGDNGEQEV
jgi:pantoate--beta-alanine ligase